MSKTFLPNAKGWNACAHKEKTLWSWYAKGWQEVGIQKTKRKESMYNSESEDIPTDDFF